MICWRLLDTILVVRIVLHDTANMQLQSHAFSKEAVHV